MERADSLPCPGAPLLRALVVELDDAAAGVCEKALRELGVEPRRAAPGEVLARLEAEAPDIVVVGLAEEAATVEGWCRSRARSPVVVLLVAAGAEPAPGLTGAAGVFSISRPLDAAELAAAVALGLHQRAQDPRLLTSDEIGALHAIGSIAASALAPPLALSRMLEQVLAATGADHSALLKTQRAGEALRFTLAASVGRPLVPADTAPPGHQGVCAWVVENRRPLALVGPLDRYPQFRGLKPNPAIAVSLVAPILWLDQVVGVLTVNSARPDGLPAGKLAFVASAAQLIGVLLRHLEGEQGHEHRQRLSMLGQMAASIAHEISNPVAFIRSNLEFVLGQLAREPGRCGAEQEELAQVLRESLEGISRIAGLAANLKSLGRKEPGKPGPVSLNQLLRRCETMVLARFRHRLELTVELGPELTVVAEPEALLQVFLNLLLNAAEVVPARAGRVALRCHERRGRAVVEVEDNGPGIPEAVAARLFEPFFTTRADGTGLGLSISRAIVRRHHGDLTFDSEPGRGTRFLVELPLAVPADRHPSVLVVDDDPSLLKALVRVLMRSGYEATSAVDANDALERLAKRPVDALVTDFRMPGGTGAELIRALRARGVKTPAVLITANFDSPEVQEALGDGLFVASLAKPWNQDELLAAVAKALADTPEGDAARR